MVKNVSERIEMYFATKKGSNTVEAEATCQLGFSAWLRFLILFFRQDSETKFTIMDFVSMTHVRKKLISNTHVMKTIREEEQLTLPAVKTLVDREYAEATRKKLRQRRFAITDLD